MNNTAKTLCLVCALGVSAAAFGLPAGAAPVGNFEQERYLGSWYEIARLDFTFERNLNNTTAEYSLGKKGLIQVRNRGYNYVTKKWKETRGKARFRGEPGIAALEVSFFGPFYAEYNVIALDPDYRYALVAGDSLKYLWILSREKTIPEEVKARYLELAASLGYNIADLIWVVQD